MEDRSEQEAAARTSSGIGRERPEEEGDPLAERGRIAQRLERAHPDRLPVVFQAAAEQTLLALPRGIETRSAQAERASQIGDRGIVVPSLPEEPRRALDRTFWIEAARATAPRRLSRNTDDPRPTHD